MSSPEQVFELQHKRRDGILIKILMAEYGLSKTSVYRYLKEDVSPDAVLSPE